MRDLTVSNLISVDEVLTKNIATGYTTILNIYRWRHSLDSMGGYNQLRVFFCLASTSVSSYKGYVLLSTVAIITQDEMYESWVCQSGQAGHEIC